MAGKALIEQLDNKKKIRRGFKMLEHVFRLTRIPYLAQAHPWMNPRKTDMRWLPINQDIELPENAPVPLTLLDRLIEEASHRVVYERCGCRVTLDCENYPPDIGCLLMGDSAVEGMGDRREVGIEEAKAHAGKAVDAGLVPVVGKARIDNFLFGIKDRGRMLTVCFCCECCCITRFTRHASMVNLKPTFPRLEGITVEVTDDCTGCGECAERCYIQAISINGGKAVIGEKCRACGRCATVCPNGSIHIKVDDPDFLDRAYERIRAHVKFD